MYEANPMSFIVEQAGGMCSTAHERIMDMAVTDLLLSPILYYEVLIYFLYQ